MGHSSRQEQAEIFYALRGKLKQFQVLLTRKVRKMEKSPNTRCHVVIIWLKAGAVQGTTWISVILSARPNAILHGTGAWTQVSSCSMCHLNEQWGWQKDGTMAAKYSFQDGRPVSRVTGSTAHFTPARDTSHHRQGAAATDNMDAETAPLKRLHSAIWTCITVSCCTRMYNTILQ